MKQFPSLSFLIVVNEERRNGINQPGVITSFALDHMTTHVVERGKRGNVWKLSQIRKYIFLTFGRVSGKRHKASHKVNSFMGNYF